jgi:hypothetical protein
MKKLIIWIIMIIMAMATVSAMSDIRGTWSGKMNSEILALHQQAEIDVITEDGEWSSYVYGQVGILIMNVQAQEITGEISGVVKVASGSGVCTGVTMPFIGRLDESENLVAWKTPGQPCLSGAAIVAEGTLSEDRKTMEGIYSARYAGTIVDMGSWKFTFSGEGMPKIQQDIVAGEVGDKLYFTSEADGHKHTWLADISFTSFDDDHRHEIDFLNRVTFEADEHTHTLAFDAVPSNLITGNLVNVPKKGIAARFLMFIVVLVLIGSAITFYVLRRKK